MKSKLNSDKNIGTVGQIVFLGDDGNLCWRDETEEEQNEIVCVIEEKDIGTFKIEGNKKMMPKIDDEIFKKLINHHRSEGLASNHIMIQALVDKIIELSERVARLEKNDS